jgi:hypothetical protein
MDARIRDVAVCSDFRHAIAKCPVPEGGLLAPQAVRHIHGSAVLNTTEKLSIHHRTGQLQSMPRRLHFRQCCGLPPRLRAAPANQLRSRGRSDSKQAGFAAIAARLLRVLHRHAERWRHDPALALLHKSGLASVR